MESNQNNEKLEISKKIAMLERTNNNYIYKDNNQGSQYEKNKYK